MKLRRFLRHRLTCALFQPVEVLLFESPQILALAGVFHILALFSGVCLRPYVRIRLLRTPGKDDAVMARRQHEQTAAGRVCTNERCKPFRSQSNC